MSGTWITIHDHFRDKPVEINLDNAEAVHHDFRCQGHCNNWPCAEQETMMMLICSHGQDYAVYVPSEVAYLKQVMQRIKFIL